MLEWERTSVNGRRSELIEKGYAEPHETRACRVTGNPCTTWRATRACAEAARQEAA